MISLALMLLAAAPAKTVDAGIWWEAESIPLQLPVKNPEDLTFKSAAERQYLIFNLLAGGKVAWDRGDYENAARKWEALLRTPNLEPQVVALVQPLAVQARARVGGEAIPNEAPMQVTMTPLEPEPERLKVPVSFVVSGSVTGGGTHGPGGAIVMLKRADGPTPRPRALRVKAVVQKDKRFVPHVLAVPLGATVEFRNDDELFHNVFSLSKPNDFDLGLYKSGNQREQKFNTAGPVQLLCNIHAAMNGWIFVSESPWFAQADASGKFTVKNVPPGNYEVEVWHEWSSNVPKERLKVSGAVNDFTIAVDGDKRAPAFVPDKSGKQRQPQLGY